MGKDISHFIAQNPDQKEQTQLYIIDLAYPT